MSLLPVVLLLCGAPAWADATQAAVQRALLQRAQQADEQALRMYQQQQRLQIAPGDLRRQIEIDRLHFEQRERQSALHGRQDTQMRAAQRAGELPNGSAATDLSRLAREREMEAMSAEQGRRQAMQRSGPVPDTQRGRDQQAR